MKIGFYIKVSSTWHASLSLIEAYAQLLKQMPGLECRLCALVESDCRENLGDAMSLFDEIISLDKNQKLDDDLIQAREDLFIQKGIEVVIGLNLLHGYKRVPTMSWIPDFQYLHLPEMFSEKERMTYERNFKVTAEAATAVILMSESVREDFEQVFPEHRSKTAVIRPIAWLPDAAFESDSKDIRLRYGLPSKFVYMPNQWWKHKNHQAFFEAIHVLKQSGLIIPVVCTGSMQDRRHASYADDLKALIKTWGIEDQIILLNQIPRNDVFKLMRKSAFVVNASLFEGYGLSLDEASSLGQRLFVSDLPVMHEHEAPHTSYMNPRDIKDIAKKLQEAWAQQSHELNLVAAKRSYQDKIRTQSLRFKVVLEKLQREHHRQIHSVV